jgi:hypothetical protein
MVSKNLPLISKLGGNLYIPKLLFGANTMGLPFKTILILGQFCLGMKVHVWYIEPNDIKNENTIKYS